FYARQRRLGLRLRGHATTERFSAGDELQSRAEPRRLLDSRADGGVCNGRLVWTPLAVLHIGKIEAKRRDAAVREARGDLVHERMPHIGARAVRQDVTGARIVRLHQNGGDSADALDVELELLGFNGFGFDGLGFDGQNQTSQQDAYPAALVASPAQPEN